MRISNEKLKQKIKEFNNLKQQKELISSRLDELSKEIKENLLFPSYAKNENIFELNTGDGVRAELQLKKSYTYDEYVTQDLLDSKDLLDAGTKRVVDPSLVEQLYYEGKLTDSDLRQIKVEKQILALRTESVQSNS